MFRGFIKRKPFEFLDKRPLVGTGLLFLQSYIVLYILMSIFVGVGVIKNMIGFVMGIPEGTDTPELIQISSIVNNIINILLAFLMLFLHKFRLRPDFDGVFKGVDNKFGFKMSFVFLIYVITTLILNIISGNKLGIRDISLFISLIMASIVEETVCRAIPISFAMRHRNKKEIIPLTAMLTALLSAVVCYINFGTDLDMTLVAVKVFAMFCMSIFLSMMFLKTGNILFNMVIRFILFVVLSTDITKSFRNTVFFGQTVCTNDYIDVVLCMILAVIGIYFVKPDNKNEIIKVWDKKWNNFKN